ncbi:universal stress protein [Actinacidiphila rubida]|uniref:Nucleotide-binding universal stress protein, UspA family n=1 Tax=Actinacidiphila rubida TaxID=310780 RepID=A0A1H8JD12_9ACTN|nr:universal stress protein [Actinacidiphila rubida]SEN78216.1 Nucleotide-binding universal stress protein, UspA family [Actinacidiphila rubida]
MTRTERVVAGVSGAHPEVSGHVVRWAADAADVRGLPLHIVHAQDWPRGTSPDAGPGHPAHVWSRHFRANGEALLDDARRIAAADRPALTVTTELAAGRAVQVLREAADAAAVLVLGARRLTGIEGAFAGSGKGHALAGHLPCPVALVPEPDTGVPDYAPLVVGVDGSPASHVALDLAFEEAAAAKADLVAVEVRRPRDYTWAELPEDTELNLAEALAGYGERYPDVAVSQEILSGNPAAVLASASERARCLVVGSRGLGGFRGMLLGSTSRALIHHTDCPLVIAPLPHGR